MSPRLVIVVAVMDAQEAIGEEERHEAEADQPGRQAWIAERTDRLGQHIEKRDCDDDAPENAISVPSSPRKRSANSPPRSVEAAVSSASGTASQGVTVASSTD